MKLDLIDMNYFASTGEIPSRLSMTFAVKSLPQALSIVGALTGSTTTDAGPEKAPAADKTAAQAAANGVAKDKPVERSTTPARTATPTNPKATTTPKAKPKPEPEPEADEAEEGDGTGEAPPAKLAAAQTFRNVLDFMMDDLGLDEEETIVAECEKYRDTVPCIGRLAPAALADRVHRGMEIRAQQK